jgi:hypothetical protein
MKCQSTCVLAARHFAAALVALLPIVCGVALAGERQGAYAGGGIGGGTTDLTAEGLTYAVNPDKSVVALEGHGGYRINPYIAVEGQIFGVANGQSDSLRKVSFAALSGRLLAIAPVSEVADIYALVGVYTGSSTVGISDTTHESGAVYGAGVQLNFGNRGQYGVRGAYEVYKGSELLDQLKAIMFSFQYNFF